MLLISHFVILNITSSLRSFVNSISYLPFPEETISLMPYEYLETILTTQHLLATNTYFNFSYFVLFDHQVDFGSSISDQFEVEFCVHIGFCITTNPFLNRVKLN